MRTIISLLLVLTPTPVVAQWWIGADVGLGAVRGASVDTSAQGVHGSVRPYQPVLFTLRAGHTTTWGRVGVSVSYAQAGLAARSGEAVALLTDVFTLVEVAPEAAIRLTRPSTSMDFLVHAGPVVDTWSESGDSRVRLGGQVATSAAWPIIARLSGVLRTGVVFTPSVFDDSDLPAELVRRTMWRWTASVGLRYGM